MEFKIVRAVPEDAGKLDEIMQTVAGDMNNPEWFMKDDYDYIKGHIGHIPLKTGDAGFIVKAVTCEEEPVTAGFFMAAFPGAVEKNLGNHIGFRAEQLTRVAHMDSVVILPKYRGFGLQKKLLRAGEEVIRTETNYCILMATVHPDNKFSLNNVLAEGYEVAAEALKYGGLRRYVMKKEIEKPADDRAEKEKNRWQSN